MANLNLDFSNVQGNVVLEEGMYNVTIEKVEEKTSSTGKPMLLVRFKEEEEGAVIFENYVLTEEALWKLKELLSAAGIECSGTVDFDTEELVGLMFKAKIVKEQYNGSDMNRIKKYTRRNRQVTDYGVVLRTVCPV